MVNLTEEEERIRDELEILATFYDPNGDGFFSPALVGRMVKDYVYRGNMPRFEDNFLYVFYKILDGEGYEVFHGNSKPFS
tara:strand:+ start:210 stop:449 length:240 start_codon:yes stop_codon:yes gene_type:complete